MYIICTQVVNRELNRNQILTCAFSIVRPIQIDLTLLVEKLRRFRGNIAKMLFLSVSPGNLRIHNLNMRLDLLPLFSI